MKPIEIYIENPCNEDWNKMKPTDQGRFCSACQKEVVDFTNFNQAQFKYYFEVKYKQQTNSDYLCGRFLTKDLQTKTSSTESNVATRQQTIKIKYKNLTFTQLFILSFILSFFIGISSCSIQHKTSQIFIENPHNVKSIADNKDSFCASGAGVGATGGTPIVENGYAKDTVFLSEPTTVYFDFGSTTLTTQSIKQLDSLIVPNDNVEKVEIVVVGHTDSRAVDSYNNDLSAKRALVVANYLTNKGYVVTENYGVGEKYPVNKNSDEKERALNRRVEIFFRIYRKTYK